MREGGQVEILKLKNSGPTVVVRKVRRVECRLTKSDGLRKETEGCPSGKGSLDLSVDFPETTPATGERQKTTKESSSKDRRRRLSGLLRVHFHW